MSLEHQQINKSKFDCGQRVDKKLNWHAYLLYSMTEEFR